MKFVKIDPPGSWCHYEAVMEMIRLIGGKKFLEVGCGPGVLSLKLCENDWQGVGIDFSPAAIEQAKTNLDQFIRNGRYRLFATDIFDLDLGGEMFDVGLSMMVMEHIKDHIGFLKRMAEFIKPGGHVMVAVPGRRDRWGIEDETVGHLRRYDRDDLKKTLASAGLTDVTVWSVAVPTANLLFHAGNFLIRHSPEFDKRARCAREQTETSGIREIRWKTVFPTPFRLILNRVALYPLFVMQRFFYRSNLGLTLLACGKVNQAPGQARPS